MRELPPPIEIAWTAGFLEGEGTFIRNKGYPKIKATQLDPESLQRLQSLYGGSLSVENGPRRQASTSRPLWSWSLWSGDAVALMRAIRPLMSARRQQAIDETLDPTHERWSGQPVRQTRNVTPA